MRKTFILNAPLPRRVHIEKKELINGKPLTRATMILLLESKGYTITYRDNKCPLPAKEFAGIELGHSYWGMVIWARKFEETPKLEAALRDAGYLDHVCSLPVEKRRDKKTRIREESEDGNQE